MTVAPGQVMGSQAETGVVYMGLRLRHPFVAGASPLSSNLDTVRRLEDGGASAIVLSSLFEEQITEALTGRIGEMDPVDPRFSELLLAYPDFRDYAFTPDAYLEHIRRVKAATAIPVIASLNGTSSGAWLKAGALIQSAGADALEVNFYHFATDVEVPGIAIETSIRDAVGDLKQSLRIPVSVKLSPFFTAFGNFAARLDEVGVDGIVMFNRFFQRDIDVETLHDVSVLGLSSSAELLLRLHWAASLHGRIRASLAVSGGIAGPVDGIKAILAGADVVQSVSGLFRHGPAFNETLLRGLTAWMEAHEIASISAARGRVHFGDGGEQSAFERAAYLQTISRTDILISESIRS
jgi:dihydroorotate dehydrogenase (fumarate)